MANKADKSVIVDSVCYNIFGAGKL